MKSVQDTFEIVFVCTGNRFRSPLAAAVFAAATAGAPVRVHSLGTLDMNGAPALPEALRASSALGLDLSSHRSRTLGDFPLGDADLVVGFETRHLTRAVVDGGGRPNRSFLLEEIVEALEGSELPETERDVQRARVAVALARVRRRASGSTAMPIRDPFGRSRAECEQTAARVHDLAVRLAAVLFGSTRD